MSFALSPPHTNMEVQMNGMLPPSKDVAIASILSGIGRSPFLVEADCRIPWRFHGSFGFGDTLPHDVGVPILQFLVTPVQRPTTFSSLWKTWELDRQARIAWQKAVDFHIVRLNSTPDRHYQKNARFFRDEIRSELSLVELDLKQIGVETFPPYNIRVGRLNTSERWEYYTLADALVRILLPHLTPRELTHPDLAWHHLLQRFKQAHPHYSKIKPAECNRRRNAFMLAVYERTLNALGEHNHRTNPLPTTGLLLAFAQKSALSLSGTSR